MIYFLKPVGRVSDSVTRQIRGLMSGYGYRLTQPTHYLDSRVETEYDNEGQPHEEMTSGLLNHSAKFGEIAINLEHFRQKCIEHKQEVIDSKDLKKYLPTSENPKFKLANASVRSALLKKTVRCWVFEEK